MAKKNKYAPKKYRVVVSKHGPNLRVAVEQMDKSMMVHSNHLTLSVSGLTRSNGQNMMDAFNLMHNALAHALGAQYPHDVDHVMEYADQFFNNMNLDVVNGVCSGDEITLEVQEMDFEATIPSSEKTRKFAHGDKRVYKYKFFDEKGEREAKQKQ